MSQSAQDAHDQPRQTRPLELGGSPWPEGGREGGRERARGGGGREPSRAEAGRKGPSPCQKVGGGGGSAAEVPPSAPRYAAPRLSRRGVPSLPGRQWLGRLILPALEILGRDRSLHAPLLTPLPRLSGLPPLFLLSPRPYYSRESCDLLKASATS